MTTCMVCQVSAPLRGALCLSCLARIDRHDGLCPEQVESESAVPLGWLVDRWGRPHSVNSPAVIGRTGSLAIYAAAISRHHAQLEHDDAGWTVRDLGSRNGTFVDEKPVDGAGATIRTGTRLRLGPVAFLFVSDAKAARMPSQAPDPLTQPIRARSVSSAAHLLGGLRLQEGSGPGAELLSDTFRARLTRPQVVLIRLLLGRAWDDAGQPRQVRGFLPSAELIALIPWSSEAPDDGHLKQLIRRLRTKLRPAGLSIEGRRGLGYRLTRIDLDADSSA